MTAQVAFMSAVTVKVTVTQQIPFYDSESEDLDDHYSYHLEPLACCCEAVAVF
jgi:hypothetical protein